LFHGVILFVGSRVRIFRICGNDICCAADFAKEVFMIWMVRLAVIAATVSFLMPQSVAPPAASLKYEYRLLATNKTSTMERELNEAASEGYRFAGVMGGETAFGGSEAVVAMVKLPSGDTGRYEYRLLATQKTSTMQKEMQRAAETGFEYKGQSVFETSFGGREVVVIMERDPSKRTQFHDYKLLATSKTSTMERELEEAGAEGYELMGITVAETSFGGQELVVIARRAR